MNQAEKFSSNKIQADATSPFKNLKTKIIVTR